MRSLRLLFTLLLVATLSGLSSIRLLYAQDLPPPQSHWEYHLGQGLRIGDTGLTIGGYGNIQYEDLHNSPRRFSAQTLSAFLSWDIGNRLRFFSELELQNFAEVQEGESVGAQSKPFDVERLYGDVYISDALTIRLGKFLTPIGRWNLIHAAPLVWTTSRPLVTYKPFAQDVTGGMLYGTIFPFGRELDYSTYLEATDDLNKNTRKGSFSQAVGFHLLSRFGPTELGISYASFERDKEDNERQNLLGMDVSWTYQRIELTGEFVYRLGEKGPNADEWGLYAQGVVPLSPRLFAIGRYEFFAANEPVPGVQRWVTALAFRPLPPIVLKAEYSFARDNAANVPVGFATSVAVLF